MGAFIGFLIAVWFIASETGNPRRIWSLAAVGFFSFTIPLFIIEYGLTRKTGKLFIAYQSEFVQFLFFMAPLIPSIFLAGLVHRLIFCRKTKVFKDSPG